MREDVDNKAKSLKGKEPNDMLSDERIAENDEFQGHRANRWWYNIVDLNHPQYGVTTYEYKFNKEKITQIR